MTIKELIRQLREWPAEWEVFAEVQGKEAPIKSVDIDSGGISTWVILSDKGDIYGS